MPETWITRAQAASCKQAFGPELMELLAEVGINVEDDTTVADDELSAGTLHRLSHAHGYFAGVAVSWQDIREQMPWLSRKQCEDLAAEAAELAGDNDMASDLRAAAIEESLARMEEDEPGSTWDPRKVMRFTAKDGKGWYVVERPYGSDDAIEIACSDGRLFEEDGSEWSEVKEGEPADG